MALHRTKGEMIARYTEGWPLDLVPGRTRDLSRPANFDKAFSKRAPYEAGDGIEGWMLVAWGNGGSGRSGTGDLCSYRRPREVAYSRRRSPFVDVCGSRRHSLFANQEGIVFACGEGADGQLGSKRLPVVKPKRAKEKAHPDDTTDESDVEFTVFKKDPYAELEKKKAREARRKKEGRLAAKAGNGAGQESEIPNFKAS